MLGALVCCVYRTNAFANLGDLCLMESSISWKRYLFYVCCGLAVLFTLYSLPADQHYLQEQANSASLKRTLSSWKAPLQRFQEVSHALSMLDDVTGGASGQAWNVELRCLPKAQCTKRLLWSLQQQLPLVYAAPAPSTQPSAPQTQQSVPTLTLQFTQHKLPKRTKGNGWLWSFIRPTQGHMSLQATFHTGRQSDLYKHKQSYTMGGKQLSLRTLQKKVKPTLQKTTRSDIVTWSAILPPLIAIFFVLITRQLLLSLFLSLLFGVVLYHQGNVFAGIEHTALTYIWKNAIYQEFSFNIIFFSLSLIGMVNICNRNGGIQGLIELLKDYASTPRSSRLITATLGIAVFFDDYANSIVVGNTMRPLTDRYRVSREKLAYLVDSTAAPIAGIALLSTWIGYEVGLIGDLIKHLGIPGNISGYSLFLSSLPYRFYCWMTLIFVFMGIFLNRDFGPMLSAEKRAWNEGKLMRDGAQPLVEVDIDHSGPNEGIPHRWYNAVVPVVVVLIAGFIGLLWSGGFFAGKSIQDALAAANSPRVFLWASLIGSAVAVILSVGQGLLSIFEALKAWFIGAKAILFAIGILVFAWSMGALSKDLGTAYYLIALLKSSLSPAWVPLLIFIMAAIISFATGTSWGTMGILLPTAAPLAYAVGGLPILILSVGAVLDGSIFGDHCSPLSDTTLFSSAATSCDHVDHVRTQAPYALTVMFVASTIGYLAVAYGMSIYLSIVLSIVCFALIFLIFGRDPNPPREDAQAQTS
ncbi:MAG TPA: hypothetical protein DCE42_00275 [Myxococcales bacterium]|nr:hypothetical protein [Deltaproteobacteria bacterium]HAA53156.1 hypothetical protein [Myxococcales bacterium]|tara:strand:- start:9007 stop:11265 length:2259 start_codon:yes stop_codon:yes gene_type:complete